MSRTSHPRRGTLPQCGGCLKYGWHWAAIRTARAQQARSPGNAAEKRDRFAGRDSEMKRESRSWRAWRRGWYPADNDEDLTGRRRGRKMIT